ncbi:hypothetical protein FB451DRAFT_628519 [Mycena latifolia]|nr:hypothetical protein FB451DRAFT_628519 [Mycena latifolia]
MTTIMKFSPNISDLFISFEIWATDNTDGLCKGFGLINPTRNVIMSMAVYPSRLVSVRRYDFGRKKTKNKMVTNLENALVKAIAKWNRLSMFELPYTTMHHDDRANKIILALAKAQRLQAVAVPYEGVRSISFELKDCPLQAIWIKPTVPVSYLEYFPTLKSLLRVKEPPPVEELGKDSDVMASSEFPDIAPSLNPFFKPMNEASTEVKDGIWKRILYVAMSVPEFARKPGAEKLSSRLPMLLVSKTFNRLALPYFYAHVVLKNSAAISSFLAILQNNPSLGPQVRSISGATELSRLYSPWRDSDNAAMLTILSQTTGLVRLGSPAKYNVIGAYYYNENTIRWDCFEAVARSSGSTLREFSMVVVSPRSKASPTVFDKFTQLRSLDWKCSTAFKCNPEDAAYDGLSNLEELRIWFSDASFFSALSTMKLESLRRCSL